MNGQVVVADDEASIVAGLMCLLEAEQSVGPFARMSAEARKHEGLFSAIVPDTLQLEFGMSL
jgi:hypothetical protein